MGTGSLGLSQSLVADAGVFGLHRCAAGGESYNVNHICIRVVFVSFFLVTRPYTLSVLLCAFLFCAHWSVILIRVWKSECRPSWSCEVAQDGPRPLTKSCFLSFPSLNLVWHFSISSLSFMLEMLCHTTSTHMVPIRSLHTSPSFPPQTSNRQSCSSPRTNQESQMATSSLGSMASRIPPRMCPASMVDT